MSEITLTTVPPNGRGCGHRKKGGLYLSLGLSYEGTPWHRYLLDPAIPYLGPKFLGVHGAPVEMMPEGWPDDGMLLLDMVGIGDYPSVAHFVEEIRRYGLSRRIPETFDFSSVGDKRVFLGLIHWRARQDWQRENMEFMPDFVFQPCKHRAQNISGAASGNYSEGHYEQCVYHCWSTAAQRFGTREVVETSDGTAFKPTRCSMPSFQFDPLNVVQWPRELGREMLEKRALMYPSFENAPGVFALFTVTHIEAVGFVPQAANLNRCSLPVAIVEE